MTKQDPKLMAAFTRVDLLAVIAAISVLAALVIVPRTIVRNQTRLKVCIGNLQQVSRAVLLYAADHKNTLPGPQADQPGDVWWWYKEQVKVYVGSPNSTSTNDQVFACPLDRGYSDGKPFCKNGRFDYGSYVLNGVTLPGTPNLAGWKLSEVSQPRRTLLVMEWAAHA